jgi:hypothetical protein
MSFADLERLSEVLAHLNKLSEVLPPRRMTPWPYFIVQWSID